MIIIGNVCSNCNHVLDEELFEDENGMIVEGEWWSEFYCPDCNAQLSVEIDFPVNIKLEEIK